MFDLRPLACGFGEQRPRALPPATIEVAPMVPGRLSACALIDRMGLDGAWAEERFRRSLAIHGRYGVVALHGPHARVVGFAVVAIDDAESTARVLRFGTDENMRRRGIMRRLFARIADDAASTGHRTVAVPVPEDLPGPRRFLQAIGFRGEGVVRGYYGPDLDAFSLEKAVGVCAGK